jgi:hypothetical protein
MQNKELRSEGASLMLILAFSLCFPSFTFAETIVLKSGRTIDGQIIEKTADYIKVKEGYVYTTYFLDTIESIDGEQVKSRAIVSGVTRSLPQTSTQKAFEVGSTSGGGAAVTKQSDEFFAEQCLEYFMNRDYTAFYKQMSSPAKKTEFQDMIILFSAEEKILGRLTKYSKSSRNPPSGSLSPPLVQSSFQYVCVFDKSDGVAIVDIVTEKNQLKVNSFTIVSSAFFTNAAKAIFAKANLEIAVRAKLRTLSNAFEAYAAAHNKKYPTDVDAQLINVKPQYLKENYFTNCTVAKPCSGYAYNPATINITAYNLTGRPTSCSVSDTKSFTVITNGNLTTDTTCTPAQ